MDGPPPTVAADDHELPVMTAGATEVVPPVVIGAGAAGGGASTGGVDATNAPALGTVGAIAGTPWAVWGAPPSNALNAPAENACPPGPVAWPVAKPEVND